VFQAPYIIYVEVVEVENIERSPLVARSTNALRQTRSEENLCTLTDSDADQDSGWSQEDEDISSQVSTTRRRTSELSRRVLMRVFSAVLAVEEKRRGTRHDIANVARFVRIERVDRRQRHTKTSRRLSQR
jgi:hypothetical protein